MSDGHEDCRYWQLTDIQCMSEKSQRLARISSRLAFVSIALLLLSLALRLVTS